MAVTCDKRVVLGRGQALGSDYEIVVGRQRVKDRRAATPSAIFGLATFGLVATKPFIPPCSDSNSTFPISDPTTMSTIPARFAQAARTSANTAEARSRVFAHYREWYRAVRPARSLTSERILTTLRLFFLQPTLSVLADAGPHRVP